MFGVETIEIVFSLIRFSLSLQSCMFNCSSSSFWPFKRPKQRRFKAFYIKKKETGFQPGLPWSPGFRVGRVSPGQLPTGFLLRPGPVPGPGRPGPGSTRRAGPGFKTMSKT